MQDRTGLRWQIHAMVCCDVWTYQFGLVIGEIRETEKLFSSSGFFVTLQHFEVHARVSGRAWFQQGFDKVSSSSRFCP